jgi:isoquinoline 1-oxidoreductase subunit beta
VSESINLQRREFVISTASIGGGMALGLALTQEAQAAFSDDQPWSKSLPAGVQEFTAWLSIAPDDTVTVRVPTPEIGNGVMTQVALTVTEELPCDWSKVRAEFASTRRNLLEKNVYNTAGFTSFFSGRSTGKSRMDVLLQAGASARERLKAAAAERWKVPVTEVEAANSVLTHKPSGRKLRYGEVTERAAAIKLASEPQIKPASEWTVLGKQSPGKLHNPTIVDGSAVFGIDVRQPNMLYAALMQSPVHGGKLKRHDFDKIKNMPGVRGVAVVDPSVPRKPVASPGGMGDLSAPQSAIAVVADHYWQARKALEALPLEWDDGAGAQWKTTDQMYKAAYAALDQEGEKIEKSQGKAIEEFAGKGKVVEARYLTPYCDQSPLEPLNGTALVTADRVDVWHPSQHSLLGFQAAASESGVAPENVHFHQTFVGGGFGRRIFGDDVRLVVAVAKQFPGRPVHVIWSREETMRQGRYRAMQAATVKASLGENGLPQAMHVRVSGKGFAVRGLADSIYSNPMIVPNMQIESQTLPLHFLTGAYRGPGYNTNAFVLETFIDECAAAAGIDPLEYRLKMFANWPDPGWALCLKEVAQKSGWGKSLPKGQGQGIAIANWGMDGKPQFGTTCAAVATVEVSKSGELKVLEVDVAFDTGRILNRDAIAAQVEGGTLFGLNMALNEELTIENGRIVEGNFDTYPMIRLADTPKINVHFGGLSGHERISEIGEPPVGPVGPAVANAIFKATGKRIRSTPIRKHDLKWT